MSDTEQQEDDKDQALYDIASDIAHEMIEGLPDKVEAAGADPLDAAYALWSFFTHILIDAGWTACDLADDAHQIQEEVDEDEEDEEPKVVN